MVPAIAAITGTIKIKYITERGNINLTYEEK
jgi:hypothetical protein